jgi:acetolactate synthase I/II/III large subunit
MSDHATGNGARALVETLVDSGVDTCFMNPGTSEMHFVAALDDVPTMRGVLALFEGAATGMADGFARMAERPACTLLHLGPGLGNGIANLHNARRARSPLVNIVGDHATFHAELDAPLQSDIAALAGNVSGWIRTSTSPTTVARDAAEAVAAALTPPGQVATLILPADVCWLDADGPADPIPPAAEGTPDEAAIEATAEILAAHRDDPGAVVLLLGGTVGRAADLEAASRISVATGAKVLADTFPTRIERGAGRPDVDRLAYLAEFVEMQLAGARHIVLVGSPEPVSFFAYPGKASRLVPEGCAVHTLAAAGDDCTAALGAVADLLGTPADGFASAPLARPEIPTGDLTAPSVCSVIGALMPEGAIVADEGNTAGIFLPGATSGAPPHDWLCLTGGAIGQGLPVATGAAIASPDRRVISVEADGSAMYTLQSLWTQAREGLDVTTVVINNGSYAILNMELDRVGADEPGPRAKEMLDISGPTLDFVALAQGMGVPATRATTAEEFASQLSRALATDGPSLVEAMVPAGF